MFMGSNNIKFDIHIPTTYRNARVNRWADIHISLRFACGCVCQPIGLHGHKY